MRGMIVVVALLGAAGVGVGAFAAHGMEKYLAEQGLDAATVDERLGWCDVAVRYHMLHTLALMVVALTTLASGRKSKAAMMACLFWLLGIALFSGGLYSMAFAGVEVYWAILPIGGLCFMIGWCSLAGLALHTGAIRDGE